MKRNLFAILLMSLLLTVSCKPKSAGNQQNGSASGDIPVEGGRTARVLSFDDEALFDTLSYSNIIRSVRYIPLETKKEAFIGRRVTGIGRIRDKYMIMSISGMTPICKLFNADGTYYADAFTMGRGPVEMTFVSSCSWNDSTGLVTILDIEGGKAVKTDVTSLEKKRFSVNNANKYYSRLVALENDNYLAKSDNQNRTADGPAPYMYVLSPDFQIVDSLCDMVNREKKTIEGVDGPQLQDFLFRYPGGAIYKDLQNDTVFFVDNSLDFNPIAIFDFGKKKPTLKESNYDSWEKKKNKIYINKIDMSDDYIHVTYDYDKLLYEAVWSLGSGQLIYKSSADLLGMNFSFDGFKGRLPFVYFIDNRLYALVDASRLTNVIPGLRPDDNAVLVEFTLK